MKRALAAFAATITLVVPTMAQTVPSEGYGGSYAETVGKMAEERRKAEQESAQRMEQLRARMNGGWRPAQRTNNSNNNGNPRNLPPCRFCDTNAHVETCVCP
jgi:hypothetical protein